MLDLNVEDNITGEAVIADQRVRELVASWREKIADEVRARHLAIRSPGEKPAGAGWQLGKEWQIEEITATLSISRV